jgi:hypothetical protein
MLKTATAVVFVVAAVTTTTAQTIDDFEGYADTPALLAVWDFATGLDTTTPNPSTGTQSMYEEGFNYDHGQGSYVQRLFEPGLDLTGKTLYGWARRDAASVATVGFRLSATDGEGVSCFTPVLLVTDTSWHRLDLGMEEHCSLLDATNITKIWYGAGNYSDVIGDIFVNYDDLGTAFFADSFETGDASRWSGMLP